MKNLIKLVSNRAIIIGLLILLQLGLLFAIIFRFQEYFVYFYTTYIIVSAAVIIKIVNSRTNPAYKIAWIIPIMLIPIFGTVIYLVFGRIRFTKEDKRKMSRIQEKEMELMQETVKAVQIEDGNHDAVIQSNYLTQYGEGALFKNTTSQYYPLGEDAFKAMLEELEKAEKYIFMEYFIVEEGKMWDAILEVLVRKAKEGLDVRFIYDDFGCLYTLPHHYYRKLENLGIKSCVFNPFVPVLSSIFNNRNHRKITVIDGKVAFTGELT
ncbi:PLDc N-terminal domain-containing protein [Vagococcus hydrophili]|uniref:PLDc N-terminal domain-containing protein n=1 Tax=Vagococcus hydrophili TaxID=2714947 RepID=UPI001EEA931A|nr:PLDc N-terminal domain-containing protein [Vagococcus hydrophili]